MSKLIVYKSTLIYAALYLKRSANPDGTITLTEQEFQDYYTLVVNNIEEERSIANAFTYEIVYDGEPEYNLNLASPETHELLKSAVYSYNDNMSEISTTANKKALSLKSTHTYPQVIATTLRPKGYEKALNIDQNKNKPQNSEPGL